MLEIEFLGTGTSTGVPQINCHCEVCSSTDPRDNRLRTSAIVRYKGKKLLIDCGPDFRTQMLRASDSDIDALLVTHIHYDHLGDIDDLRAYCKGGHRFPVYARRDVLDDIRRRMPYCFQEHLYPGVPTFNLHEVGEEPFVAEGISVQPIPVWHYKMRINGYRIGPLAYITDCKTIEPEQVEKLRGVPLLVINALRIEPHMSHMSLSEALAVIDRIKPGRALLTHMSHGIGLHAQVSRMLPAGVQLAHDRLIVQVPD